MQECKGESLCLPFNQQALTMSCLSMEGACRTACDGKHLAPFQQEKHTELMRTVLSEAHCDSVRSIRDYVDVGLRVQASGRAAAQ